MATLKTKTNTPAKKDKKPKGKWTRRGFMAAGVTAGLAAGGALIIGVAIRPGHRGPKLAKYSTSEGESLLTAWVKIAPDNTVTAIIPHGEMGQGVHTALSAMLAEELDADWSTLEVMEAPAEKEYANFMLGKGFIMGDKAVPGFVEDTLNGAFLSVSKGMNLQITGGSASVRFTGRFAIQVAGAAAREILMKAASSEWDVKQSELRTSKGVMYHDASSRSEPYAHFAPAASKLKPSLHPKMKARKDYTLMGTSLPRIDLAGKVDGSAQFGIDADVEGMKYATVKASPVHGQTVESLDAREAKAMPGVIGVYNMGSYVAVVADGYWQAKQALDYVDVTFTSGETDTANMESIFAQYAQALDSGKRKSLHSEGDANAAFEAADASFDAEYRVPYLAHACMEPMNATAWVRDGMCDIWAGTQNPLGTRAVTAEVLGMDMKNVTLHTAFMGGGFGRRAMTDYTDQAALLSQKAGVPIKLIWSREESTQQDHYRPSVLGRIKSAVDADGLPVSWHSVFVHKLDPAEACRIPYNVAHQSMSFVQSPTHVRLGPWRSVDHTQHGFFTESYVDELAHNAGLDGYEYRRKLLAGKPRFLKVLDTAARNSGWGTPLPAGQARGISIVESFSTIVAEVVTVDMSNGAPKVLHVACAADAGMAVNPDGFTAQMESGIIYGLTAALYGNITIEDGAVAQSNFHDYEMIRMDTAPKIDVEIVLSDAPLGGAGEPGTPPIAPALANAIFAATGTRVRSLPILDTNFRPIDSTKKDLGAPS